MKTKRKMMGSLFIVMALSLIFGLESHMLKTGMYNSAIIAVIIFMTQGTNMICSE